VVQVRAQPGRPWMHPRLAHSLLHLLRQLLQVQRHSIRPQSLQPRLVPNEGALSDRGAVFKPWKLNDGLEGLLEVSAEGPGGPSAASFNPSTKSPAAPSLQEVMMMRLKNAQREKEN
jgi:hypothetical protein